MGKTVRILHIGIHQPEQEVVEKIEAEGHQLSEILRMIIRDYGKTNYPEEKAYAVALKTRAEIAKQKAYDEERAKKMTPEEYVVEILRGKVVDGSAYFRLPGRIISQPLGNIKDQTVDNNEIIRIHNQLLDRTFEWPGNATPRDEQEWEKFWAGWEAL